MNNQEYEQKKRECWMDLALDAANMNKVTLEEYKRIFNGVFDKAYALGEQETKQETKQEKDADTVIQGWVARDDGERWHERELHLFTRNKPERRKLMGDWIGRPSMMLDSSLFPDLTWDSEPEPVEIIIRRKKK